MVMCLWFVLIYLLSTTFLFTYLRNFHLHCLHYLTDYNKGNVLLTSWEHLKLEVEGRRLLNLIHVYCNNNFFSCFFNNISLSHQCQGTPKKRSLEILLFWVDSEGFRTVPCLLSLSALWQYHTYLPWKTWVISLKIMPRYRLCIFWLQPRRKTGFFLCISIILSGVHRKRLFHCFGQMEEKKNQTPTTKKKEDFALFFPNNSCLW